MPKAGRPAPSTPILHSASPDVSHVVTMRLTDQEKQGMAHLLHLLLDADEPMTMLACLRHMAERKAFGAIRGRIERAEGNEWMRLADALRGVEDRLKDAA